MPKPDYVCYRLYMQARPGFPPETWDEVGAEAEIDASVAELRKQYPGEPVRVFGLDDYGNETWFRTDDPDGRLTPEEDTHRRPPQFTQQNTGQTLPPEADTVEDACEQCGKVTTLTQVRLSGMGPDVIRFCCAECLADMAAGQDALPLLTLRIRSKGRWVAVDGTHKHLDLAQQARTEARFREVLPLLFRFGRDKTERGFMMALASLGAEEKLWPISEARIRELIAEVRRDMEAKR